MTHGTASSRSSHYNYLSILHWCIVELTWNCMMQSEAKFHVKNYTNTNVFIQLWWQRASLGWDSLNGVTISVSLDRNFPNEEINFKICSWIQSLLLSNKVIGLMFVTHNWNNFHLAWNSTRSIFMHLHWPRGLFFPWSVLWRLWGIELA